MNETNLIIYIVLGFFVLLSYFVFIALPSRPYTQWWFGMNKIPNFLVFFTISAMCAAISFCYLGYYWIEYLETEKNQKLIDHLQIEISIILSSAILWAPFVYQSFNKNFFKYLAVIALGITAGSSWAVLAYIIKYGSDTSETKGAIAAAVFFVFHTFFVDFLGWDYFYLKNL